MTQLQYELICRCITVGMPAMANELLAAFTKAVNAHNNANVHNDVVESEDKNITE